MKETESGKPKKFNRRIDVLDLKNEYEEFQDLCTTCFEDDAFRRQRDAYEWYYDNNPYNPPNDANMMYIMKDCEEDEKMIAADGLTPCELYVKGDILKTAHSVRTMTHPNYRKQGIFKTMTENSIDYAKRNGLDIILGFANKTSYPGYNKFGWETVFVKDIFVLPVNITMKLKSKIKVGFLASMINGMYRVYYKAKVLSKTKKDKVEELKIQKLDKVPEDVNEVWEKYKGLYEVLIARDYKYLNYRYNEMPTEEYTTLMVTSKGEKIGYTIIRGKRVKQILEIFTDPMNEDYISTLLDATIKFCDDGVTESIQVLTGYYGKYRKVFEEYHFMSNIKSHRENYRTMIVLPLTEKVKEEDVKVKEAWYISIGDGESAF